ncbi:MAG: hypothetical protein KDE19_20185 [Caldilineaceae bacterium]|nr:hypothetical protein [Caldilineaceae bacterium]
MAEQALQWLSFQPRLLVVTVILGILVVSWISTALYNGRRGWSFVTMLQESTRGQVLVERAPGAGGFFILLTPPPEPFRRIAITFHTAANPLVWPWRWLVGQPPRLVIQATLLERLRSELIWERGRIPAKALSRRGNAALWVQRRLDFLNYEYATRGSNPNGLIHHFADLQTRFGPALYKVAVQGDIVPEIEVGLRTAGLNPEELPPLITTIRALGRDASL